MNHSSFLDIQKQNKPGQRDKTNTSTNNILKKLPAKYKGKSFLTEFFFKCYHLYKCHSTNIAFIRQLMIKLDLNKENEKQLVYLLEG